jgi:hypothetical protein
MISWGDSFKGKLNSGSGLRVESFELAEAGRPYTKEDGRQMMKRSITSDHMLCYVTLIFIGRKYQYFE